MRPASSVTAMVAALAAPAIVIALTAAPVTVMTFTSPANAATFSPAPIFQDEGVDVLDRSVTREALDRDLFANPWATVVVGNVDVYDRFPYLEARYFQVVSDPAWDRLLHGELGRGVSAHDGRGSSFGQLASPRGLSTDEQGRVYVADTDNHRVLVYDTWTEFDRMELVPLYVIEGLSRPYDVAFSNAGTPFDRSDDRLYVADTGRNRVVSYALSQSGATPVAAIGELGSGPGYFAGPVAITVGRENGVHTDRVYVADSHNGRVVELVDDGPRMDWSRERRLDRFVTSLDTDHWGQIYAAAPQAGEVVKLSAALEPVATLESERPRAFHVPFVTRTDHRDGSVSRVGQGSGLVVEEWSETSGLRLVRLGVEVRDLEISAERDVNAEFLLTDRGTVSGEILDRSSGQVIHRVDAGVRNAGRQSLAIPAGDLADRVANGDYVLRVQAASTYEDGPESGAESGFTWRGGAVAVTRATLHASDPNPFRDATSIRFSVPRSGAAKLEVFDVTGRQVRVLADGPVDAGTHAISWDGRDASGSAVASGVYLYRLDVAGEIATSKAVRLR